MIIDVQHHWTVFDPYTGKYSAEPLELRVAEMDQFGIDKAAMSNQARPDDQTNVEDHRLLNGKMKEAVSKYPDRFIPLPSVPLSDLKSGLEIMEEAISKLEPTGIFVRPHKGRIDSPEIWPLYEKVCNEDLTVVVHPIYPEPTEYYKPFHLGGAVGFMFNTTLAAAYAIFSGLLEAFPKLRIVFPHLGGTLPFLIGRIDNTYEISGSKIPKRPIEYFKRLYFDTACYHQEALDYTCKMVGPDKLLLGTDYGCPYKECFVKPALQIEMINKLDISDEDKKKILGDNAAKLLKVETIKPIVK